MTLGVIDVVLILAYVAGVLVIGFKAAKRATGDADDFFLAGRTLTLPFFVATLVSTWYGGILGVGEFSYRFGLSNWFVLGVPYYLFAAIFALTLAAKVRGTNLATIPDKLEAAYGRPVALAGAVLTFVLVTPAAYVLMLGILVQLLFGLNLTLSVVAATLVTVVYLHSGGFRSGIWVNAFEFILMFLGFAVMVFMAVETYGGLSFIEAGVPERHLTWHGGNSWQYIAVWFFIALWTLVDPAFHQRCYAARDGATARKGILVSILFWFCFDALTTVTGLYARAALPGLEEPMFSYPLLAEAVLPPVAKGLFVIGLLATIMSSLSSMMFISAMTVGKDLVGRWRGGSPETSGRWTRIGLGLSAAFAIALALLLPSVVTIWYTIGTTIIPGLLVPVLAGYFDALKIRPGYALAAMLLGWLTSTASLVQGLLASDGAYWFGVEPMVPGLAVSLVVWGLGRLRFRS